MKNNVPVANQLDLIKKIKTVDPNNHIHSSEDIFIKNYYYTKDNLAIDNLDLEDVFLNLKKKEIYTLFNADDIFDVICFTGKFFLNYCNLENENSNLHDIIFNSFQLNIKEITTFYKKWIYVNGYPYNCDSGSGLYKNLVEDIYNFFNHCIYLYILFEIHKYIIKALSILDEKTQENKRLKNKEDTLSYNYNRIIILKNNSNFYNYLDLIKEDLNFNLKHPDMPKESKNDKTISEEKALKYFDKMEKYFNDLKTTLTEYIHLTIDNQPISNFYVTKQKPIFDKKEKNFNLYYSAYSIMGIAYNQLLLHTVSNKYFLIKRRICANPDCNIDFEKNGQTKYCEICIINKIPEKLKRQKYEDSIKGKEMRKQYHDEYRKKGKKKKEGTT